MLKQLDGHDTYTGNGRAGNRLFKASTSTPLASWTLLQIARLHARRARTTARLAALKREILYISWEIPIGITLDLAFLPVATGIKFR
jgi:hypothetical protein